MFRQPAALKRPRLTTGGTAAASDDSDTLDLHFNIRRQVFMYRFNIKGTLQVHGAVLEPI